MSASLDKVGALSPTRSRRWRDGGACESRSDRNEVTIGIGSAV